MSLAVFFLDPNLTVLHMLATLKKAPLAAAAAALSFAAVTPTAAIAQGVGPSVPGVERIAQSALNARASKVAASPSPDPLRALVEEAWRNNPGLAAERHAQDAAQAGVREAGARLLPSLTVDSRYSDQRGGLNLGDVVNPAYAALNQLTGTTQFPTNVDLTLPQRFDGHVRLSQPIVNLGLWAGRDAARERLYARSAETRAAARRLAAEVQTAWLDAASARASAGVWEAALARVRESERVAQRLVEAGQSTPDALFRSRAEASDVEQRLAEARSRAKSAVWALNELLGRPLDAPLDSIADSLLVREVPVTEEEAVASAVSHRDELTALEAGARAADAGERAATAAFLPSVAVALDYGVQGRDIRFDGDHDYAVASLVVSWNLFNGGGDAARRDEARAQSASLRARREETEQRMRVDARRAWDEATVARASIGVAQDRLAAARRTFELVRRRYEEGEAPQIELIDARTALTDAELNSTLTLYGYAAKLVDLERAAALRTLD